MNEAAGNDIEIPAWNGPYSLTQRIYYCYLLGTYGLVIGVSVAMSAAFFGISGNTMEFLASNVFTVVPLLIVLMSIMFGSLTIVPFFGNRSVIFFARKMSTRGTPSSQEIWIRMSTEGGLSILLWALFDVVPYFAIYTSAVASLAVAVATDASRLFDDHILSSYREAFQKLNKKAKDNLAGKIERTVEHAISWWLLIFFFLPLYASLFFAALICAVVPFAVWSDGSMEDWLWVLVAGIFAFSFVDAWRRHAKHPRLPHEHSPFASNPDRFGGWDWIFLHGCLAMVVTCHPATTQGHEFGSSITVLVWISFLPLLMALAVQIANHADRIAKLDSADASDDTAEPEHGETSADTP